MPVKATKPRPEVTAAEIKRALKALGDPAIAEHSQRFLKTGKDNTAKAIALLASACLCFASRWHATRTHRVAIMSTYHFIRNHDFDDSIAISLLLLGDDHDLIHKAVGWKLREVGNRERQVEEQFRNRNYQQMPRTMLRYAIEKFPGKSRQAYLKGEI